MNVRDVNVRDVAALFDVPLSVLGPSQDGDMANTKRTQPADSEPQPQPDSEPELTLEEFALARGQRINNGIDSGVKQAYQDYLARRAAGTS